MVYLFFFWISITCSYFNLIHFHTCNSLWLVLRMLCAAKTWLSILHCCSTAWKLNHGAGREERGEVCILNPRLWLKAELWYSWHCSTYVFRYAVWWIIFPCISPEMHWQVFNSCRLELGWQQSLSLSSFCGDRPFLERCSLIQLRVTGPGTMGESLVHTQSAGGCQEVLLGPATPAFDWLLHHHLPLGELPSEAEGVVCHLRGLGLLNNTPAWLGWALALCGAQAPSRISKTGPFLTIAFLSPEVMDGLCLKTACGCPLAVCQWQDITKDYQCLSVYETFMLHYPLVLMRNVSSEHTRHWFLIFHLQDASCCTPK